METKSLVNAANIITTKAAAQLIRGTMGKIFSAMVITRGNNGAERYFTGRFKEEKETTGKGKGYNDKDHSLLTIHEFVRMNYTPRNAKGQFSGSGNMMTQHRSIAIEGIRKLKVGGKSYTVKHIS